MVLKAKNPNGKLRHRWDTCFSTQHNYGCSFVAKFIPLICSMSCLHIHVFSKIYSCQKYMHVLCIFIHKLYIKYGVKNIRMSEIYAYIYITCIYIYMHVRNIFMYPQKYMHVGNICIHFQKYKTT